MTRELTINEIYRHFKGHIYKVICVAKDAENLKEKVVYQNIYDENDIWIRDKEEFLSLIDKEKYPNEQQKYRFERINLENGPKIS